MPIMQRRLDPSRTGVGCQLRNCHNLHNWHYYACYAGGVYYNTRGSIICIKNVIDVKCVISIIVNTRLGTVSTQNCTAWADRAGCGPDWLTLTRKVLCFELPVGPSAHEPECSPGARPLIIVSCIREEPSEVSGKWVGEAKTWTWTWTLPSDCQI